MVSRCLFFFFFALQFFGASAQTKTVMSGPEIYGRCYAQFTGKPVPLKSSILNAIQAGRISALSACEALLQTAELAALDGRLLVEDETSRAVLKRFYDFHRSWFAAGVVEQIQDHSTEASRGTVDVYDTTEPALALTRAAFTQGAKYSDVLTLDRGLRAMRKDDPSLRARLGWTMSYASRSIYGNNAGEDQNLVNFRALSGGFENDPTKTNSILLTMPKVQVGELVGIRPVSESFQVPNLTLIPFSPAEKRGNEQPGLQYTYDFFASMGGGVLGMPSYLLLNFGHPMGVTSNGTTKVPRRWASATMSSFMCATLPVLREADIRSFYVGGSSTPFRGGASCLRCHATLDPMAYTARNVVIGNSDYASLDGSKQPTARPTMLVASYRAELPSVAGWPAEPVADFHRQIPSGRLLFRSFNGSLVDRPVQGISGLGSALTETDDYYQCAAKRYFEFMTGIQVALYDRQNPENESLNRALTSRDIEDRRFVEQLGTDLRRHQSVRLLIQQILRSPYYQSPNFRIGGGE